MNKEEILLQKRLIELSEIAYSRGIVTFSDFMNLNELNILHTTPKNRFRARYETFGGYDLSERQMAAFLPDALYYTLTEEVRPSRRGMNCGMPCGDTLPDDYPYPITMLEISPINRKFSENLNHRDYLGAVMNLGIERCKLGDIIVCEDKAYLFAKEELADYIAAQLTCIRHTPVKTRCAEDSDVSYEPVYEEIKGTVPSVRLDTVLSLAYPMSRSKLVGCIEGGRVYVNGKLITSNGQRLKEGDLISLRQMGRISYQGILSKTKKGRYMVSVRKYR